MALRGRPTKEPLSYEEALEAALGLLALRPHLAGELIRKLRRRPVEEPVIERVLERLRHLGLLDDSAVAGRFAEETTRRRRWGALRVQNELRQRGAPEDAVRAALAELGEPLTLARSAAQRWLERHRSRSGSAPDTNRLARHLARLGHPATAVRTVLGELGGDLGLDDEE